MMRNNKIRDLLKTGRPTNATRLDSAWPFYVEQVGLTQNFDYIEFLAEYSPVTQDQMENLARAAELYNMGTMIKVDFQNRGYVAQKAVGSGFQGINFTDHRNADEVRETVRMMKPETPEDGGIFGYPNRRFIGCTPHIDQLAHADRLRDIVLCFMIEKKAAVEDIDAICAVPGVDMVQFGPSDYAMSCGWNGNEHKAEIFETEKYVIKTALMHGVQPRCEIDTLEQAKVYMSLGVRHFCLGDQSRILNAYWKGEGGRMREAANQM